MNIYNLINMNVIDIDGDVEQYGEFEEKMEDTCKKIYLNDIVNKLFDSYKHNNYMMQRLQYYVTNLPCLLENDNKKYNERAEKMTELIHEQNNFFVSFLSKYKYYHIPTNSKFYEYDGKHYRIVDENDVIHRILSKISCNVKLSQWKYKTQIALLKKIKNTSLFSSIPEEYTIKNVLKFLELLFYSEEEIIYFLCIIGDCILKKNVQLLYFIKQSAKKLILAIDYIIYMNAGFSIADNFIVKHHENHTIVNYRLIRSKTIPFDTLELSVNTIGLDIICVATYFSELYKQTDNYVTNHMNHENMNYCLYFVHNTPEKIADDFIHSCIEPVSISTNDETQELNLNDITKSNVINWKNMYYIWKLYLHRIKVPTFLYTISLQQLLMSKLKHTLLPNDIHFNDVTSKYLPNVSSFLDFWNDCIIIVGENSNEYDYTTTELMQLYKMSGHKTGILNEKNMIRIINHYFSSQVSVIDEKYIRYIKCKTWLKDEEIDAFLSLQKYELIKSDFYMHNTCISLNLLYDIYKKDVNELVISKDYFQKYVCTKLQCYMNDDNSIDLKWIEN